MKTIRETLAKSPERRIPQVIRLLDGDDATLSAEIDEYVIGESLRDQHLQLLRAIVDSSGSPASNSLAVVCGLAGAGKTAFLKYLGYAIGGSEVFGKRYSSLFVGKSDSNECEHLLQALVDRCAFEVIFVDVAEECARNPAASLLCDILLSVTLRSLGYAEDPELAALEANLEEARMLDAFSEKCSEMLGQDWATVRRSPQKYVQASAILHELDSTAHPEPDSWIKSTSINSTDHSTNLVGERIIDFLIRRRPGRSPAFVIDNLGSVLTTEERSLEFRATLERRLSVGQQRHRQGSLPAPCWLILASEQDGPSTTEYSYWAKLESKAVVC